MHFILWFCSNLHYVWNALSKHFLLLSKNLKLILLFSWVIYFSYFSFIRLELFFDGFFCSCPYVIDDYSHRILWTCEYILLLHFVKVLLLETTIQTEIPFTEVPLYSLTNASMFFCFQLKKKWNFALFRWNKLVFYSSLLQHNWWESLYKTFSSF